MAKGQMNKKQEMNTKEGKNKGSLKKVVKKGAGMYKGEPNSVAGAFISAGLFPTTKNDDNAMTVTSQVPDAHIKVIRRNSVLSAIMAVAKMPQVKAAMVNLKALQANLQFRRRTIFAAMIKIAVTGNVPKHVRASWARTETTKMLPLIKHAARLGQGREYLYMYVSLHRNNRDGPGKGSACCYTEICT